jgi:lysozyme
VVRAYRSRLRGYLVVRKAVLAVAAVALGVAAATIVVVRIRTRAAHDRSERASCQPGPTTPGIDVSYHQETIDWHRVQRAGIRFAFIRLSDGAAIRDTMFATNWAESKRAGLVRGAYQFFRPDQSATAQADLMIAAMRGRDHDDLPPVIDIEVDGGLSAPEVAARAQAWVDRVRDRLGVEPIVYTGGDLWRNGGAEPIGAQPLWIAHYTQGCPTLPQPWTQWRFWQHTDHGAVPGIDGPVDLDLFAGTLGELHAAR